MAFRSGRRCGDGAEGTSVFTEVGELRVKEVDRLAAVVEMVTAFGASASVAGDTLSVTGVGPQGRLQGARFDSQGDHRMAMAAAIAALAAGTGQRSQLTGFDAVATSYPRFTEDLRGLTAGAPESLRPRPLVVAIDLWPARRQVNRVRAVAAHLGSANVSTPGPCTGPSSLLALRQGVAPDDLA